MKSYSKSFLLSIVLLTGPSFHLVAQIGTYNKAIQQISEELAEGLVKKGKKALSITDFVNADQEVPELGRLIAEDLEAALLSPDYDFTIVTRKQMDRILEEQKISRSDLTEPENVKSLGGIKNIDVLIVGKLVDWADEIGVTVQVVDVQTGVYIFSVPGYISKFPTIVSKFENIQKEKNANTEEYNRLIAEASKFYLNEDFQGALNLYAKAKDLLPDPQNESALNGISHCNQKIEEKERMQRQENAWIRAKSYDNVNAYEEYQNAYPSGKYYESATAEIKRIREAERKKMDESAWQLAQRSGSVEGYQNYLREFPNGEHYYDASARINKIEEDERIKEVSDWEFAEKINTIDAYQEYLNKYPDGLHSNIAKQKIEEQKNIFQSLRMAAPLILQPISGLKVSNGKNYRFQTNIQNGVQIYVDRNYYCQNVPEYLKGSGFIVTACDDKFSTGNNLIEFTANQNVRVYIVYDPNYSPRPQWLNYFQGTPYKINILDPQKNYGGSLPPPCLLYERNYNKGEIVRLGGNSSNSNYNGWMYFVIIKSL